MTHEVALAVIVIPGLTLFSGQHKVSTGGHSSMKVCCVPILVAIFHTREKSRNVSLKTYSEG